MSEEIQKAKAVMESLKLEYIYLHYDCTWINLLHILTPVS